MNYVVTLGIKCPVCGRDEWLEHDDRLGYSCLHCHYINNLPVVNVGVCADNVTMSVVSNFITSPKPEPKQIIYNGITTICIFHDNTKVISRPQKGEKFDKETGVAMCIAKYIYGSRSKFLKAVESGYDQKERQP